MAVPGFVDYDGYTEEQALASVGLGWTLLIKKLWAAKPAETIVVQVKEKFGGLRFYTYHSTAEFNELIRQVEDESYRTCEECGAAGVLDQSHYWVKTLCPVHTADRNERRAKKWGVPRE